MHSVENQSMIFSLLGAAGDLSQRLIVPALYNLYLDGQLPRRFALIGVDNQPVSAQELADRFKQGVAEHSRRGLPDEKDWAGFAAGIRSLRVDLTDALGFKPLGQAIDGQEREWKAKAGRIFYMATPPGLFEPIAQGLGAAALNRDRERARVVVEKPLGRDLDSFRAINAALTRFFHEEQIFRIDHFLGKETVQNILALRFANPIFEPIWNRNYIDHIVITVAETLGVEHRASYYEHAGALRDMVQNHLMQLLCLVAMEPPASYRADDIRDRKMDVMHALRPISRHEVSRFAARGQYGPGWIKGEQVPAYRSEPQVAPDSPMETYVALKLFVDNWRWQDVPFYLRTGKRLMASVSEISIRFRPVPHRAFPSSIGDEARPVSLILRLQPDEMIRLLFYAKEPGLQLRLRPVNMDFSYREAFKIDAPAAYETLLWDVMAGDASLFMRTDQVEAAWGLLQPILEVWQENPAADFPNYASGTWGPECAEPLIATDGRAWLAPVL